MWAVWPDRGRVHCCVRPQFCSRCGGALRACVPRPYPSVSSGCLRLQLRDAGAEGIVDYNENPGRLLAVCDVLVSVDGGQVTGDVQPQVVTLSYVAPGTDNPAAPPTMECSSAGFGLIHLDQAALRARVRRAAVLVSCCARTPRVRCNSHSDLLLRVPCRACLFCVCVCVRVCVRPGWL